MRLRSGFLLGQHQANQAVEEPAGAAMQEDNFSIRAEWGTPHPSSRCVLSLHFWMLGYKCQLPSNSSFSTNDNITSPKSPALGEAGPSNYRDAHQPIPRSLQEGRHQEDFQLFDTPTPTTDPTQYNNSLPEDDIPIPPTPQRPFISDYEGPTSNYTYFKGDSGHATPTQPSLYPLQTTQSPGMIQEWTSGTTPWSPVGQTPQDSRKRSLFEDNPTQDLTGYPRDRTFKDKMETEIEEIEKRGSGVDTEEEKRKKKKPRRSARVRKGMSRSAGHESARKDHDQDRGRDGQGSGQSMRVV